MRAKVLDVGAGRVEEPRHRGCADLLLRRPVRAPGRDHHDLAGHHRANLLRAPDAGQSAVRLEETLPATGTGVRAIYTAPTEAAAEQALAELEASPLGQRYPAIARTWRSAWPEFVLFLAFPPGTTSGRLQHELDRVDQCPAAEGDSQPGSFPSEQAAVKVLYLAIRELIEPKAGDRNQVAPGWKSALNALTLYFEDRITIR